MSYACFIMFFCLSLSIKFKIMSNTLHHEKVYKITCINTIAPYDKKIIWNRSYNYSDNWTFEKELLEFWGIPNYTILSVDW